MRATLSLSGKRVTAEEKGKARMNPISQNYKYQF